MKFYGKIKAELLNNNLSCREMYDTLFSSVDSCISSPSCKGGIPAREGIYLLNFNHPVLQTPLLFRRGANSQKCPVVYQMPLKSSVVAHLAVTIQWFSFWILVKLFAPDILFWVRWLFALLIKKDFLVWCFALIPCKFYRNKRQCRYVFLFVFPSDDK